MLDFTSFVIAVVCSYLSFNSYLYNNESMIGDKFEIVSTVAVTGIVFLLKSLYTLVNPNATITDDDKKNMLLLLYVIVVDIILSEFLYTGTIDYNIKMALTGANVVFSLFMMW